MRNSIYEKYWCKLQDCSICTCATVQQKTIKAVYKNTSTTGLHTFKNDISFILTGCKRQIVTLHMRNDDFSRA